MTDRLPDLRERIRRLPGMERLLPALAGLPPAYLVGGAVRDLLRGVDAVDLDLAVEGAARSVARALAERLDGVVREHERFGTATVRAGDLTFDLAATRTETYDEPGALPRVAPATLADDLRRRDFTVNAMAVALSGDDLGHLYDPHGGRADLEAGVVRVLHIGSFLDDPTRLLRAVRYETRLGFHMDPATERAARAAVAEDAMSTVSGARVRDELMDMLAEHEAPSAVERMRDLGLARALDPALDPIRSWWPRPRSALRRSAPTARSHRWRRCARARPPSSTRGWPACSSRPLSATPCRGRRGWRRRS